MSAVRQSESAGVQAPHSIEAEESVIGMILVHPAKLSEAKPVVRPADFYSPVLRHVYESMLELAANGSPVDQVTVIDHMRACGTYETLNSSNGPDYLFELTAKVVTAENIAYHARLVREKSDERERDRLVREYQQRRARGDSAQEQATNLTRRLLDIERSRPGEALPAPPTAAEVFRSATFSRAQRVYPTGFPDLDELTRGGFRSGKVHFICGPTGGGKTGFVGTIANHQLEQRIPVLSVETELDVTEKAARFASNRFHQKGWRACPDDFLGHHIVPEKGAAVLDDAPLYIINVDDDPEPFTTIRNHATAIKAKHGQPPVIVIDYVQCLAYEGEDLRLSTIGVVKHCRRIARDLDCCVIAISSVARAFQGRNRRLKNPDGTEDPLDWLTAAAESSVIEYTGAIIAYLDTADEVDALGEAAARLIVCKARGGRRGFVGLRFHGPSGAFRAAPESLEAMGTAAKSNRDDDRVLAFVKAADYLPMPKRQLRTAIKGMGATAVDAAVDRLLLAKRIDSIKNPNPRARGELIVPVK